jgi:chromosome segregation ATPase
MVKGNVTILNPGDEDMADIIQSFDRERQTAPAQKRTDGPVTDLDRLEENFIQNVRTLREREAASKTVANELARQEAQLRQNLDEIKDMSTSIINNNPKLEAQRQQILSNENILEGQRKRMEELLDKVSRQNRLRAINLEELERQKKRIAENASKAAELEEEFKKLCDSIQIQQVSSRKNGETCVQLTNHIERLEQKIVVYREAVVRNNARLAMQETRLVERRRELGLLKETLDVEKKGPEQIFTEKPVVDYWKK